MDENISYFNIMGAISSVMESCITSGFVFDEGQFFDKWWYSERGLYVLLSLFNFYISYKLPDFLLVFLTANQQDVVLFHYNIVVKSL